LRHEYIVPITIALLAAAFLAAVGWLIYSPDFEPAVTSLALLAAITGLFIDRWVVERQHRKQLLRALMHELYANNHQIKELRDAAASFNTEQPHVILPRFLTSTLGTVIASGVFTGETDAQLWFLLHRWQHRATDANVRLSAMEAHLLRDTRSKSGYRDFATSKLFETTHAQMVELTSHLLERYSAESGINEETVIFPDGSESKGTEGVSTCPEARQGNIGRE
jgi:hypothetical protein